MCIYVIWWQIACANERMLTERHKYSLDRVLEIHSYPSDTFVLCQENAELKVSSAFYAFAMQLEVYLKTVICCKTVIRSVIHT